MATAKLMTGRNYFERRENFCASLMRPIGVKNIERRTIKKPKY